jgi:NitT/TauT family transport system permease protein
VDTVRQYLPAALLLFGVLVAWELLVQAAGVRGFILPAPSAIWTALTTNWTTGFAILPAAQVTLFEAMGGLVIGTILGVTTAFVVSRFPASTDTVLPLAVAINAIPIIAFAPVANNWFGITSPLSKMAVAATLVYFPIMISTLRGLTQVEPAALELMRSYAARATTVTREVRVPNALPFFFTGLKVATTLSLIGAVVGEYFGGLSATLGRVVVAAASGLKFDVTWAAILVVSVIGIVLYLGVALLERIVIPWHASIRGDQPG